MIENIIKNYLEDKFHHSFRMENKSERSISESYWYPKFDCICKKCNYTIFICVVNIALDIDLIQFEDIINIHCKHNLININDIKFIICSRYSENDRLKSIQQFDKESDLLTCEQYIIKTIVE